jgi:two-component system phosphate regulon sensor histidine kinase PhoR
VSAAAPTPFRSRFFSHLAASYAGLLIVTAVVIGLFVDHHLRRSLLAGFERSLKNSCLLLAPYAAEAFRGKHGEALQADLVRLGRETGFRITLIRPDGTVIGDSFQDPAAMDLHASRPEVLAAERAEFGVSERHSDTVGYPMLYVARRIHDGGAGLGTLRLSMRVSEVAEQLGAARQGVLFGTAVGLLAALGLGLWLARRVSRPIAALTRAAEGLRSGDYASRVDVGTRDEIGVLADALNRLGEEVTSRIARLSQDDAQLRAMLTGMVEGVVAADERDRISFCNEDARRALGLRAGDLVGQDLRARAPAPVTALLDDVRASNAMERREVTIRGEHGDRVLTLHGSPFTGGGGRGVVVVAQDVTEMRRLERVRRDFVANVSHELQTPLASIKGFVETLLSGALHDDDHNERFLRRIDANVDRLTRLVADLLSLARIESHADETRRVPVDLRAVLADVLRRHGEALAGRGLDLRVEAPAAGVRVLGDPDALVQVLENLLDNAAKYTPAPGRITVRLSGDEESGFLEVEDTGIGIAPEHHDRIFERFYRVDKARSREVGGTGLGLSIVKNLVFNMGGDVHVESEPGRGAKFVVELEAAPETARPPDEGG